jgi:hypothetical protein
MVARLLGRLGIGRPFDRFVDQGVGVVAGDVEPLGGYLESVEGVGWVSADEVVEASQDSGFQEAEGVQCEELGEAGVVGEGGVLAVLRVGVWGVGGWSDGRRGGFCQFCGCLLRGFGGAGDLGILLFGGFCQFEGVAGGDVGLLEMPS